MKSSPKISLTLVALIVASLIVWRLWPAKHAAPVRVHAAAPTPPPAVQAAPAPAPAPRPVVIPENPTEIAASERMYAAHASLRTPEVADPDSRSNRQALQSMVQKMLAQPATPPPAAPAKL